MDGFDDELTAGIKRVEAIIAKFVEEESRVPSLPSKTPLELKSALDLKIQAEGKGILEVMDLAEEVALLTPRTGSRRFFNQLFGGRNAAAVAGEMLTAVFNSSMYTYKVAGIHVLIENELLDTMCGLAEFEDGWGIFSPGGSLSNMVAMMIARNEADSRIRDGGIQEPWLTAYSSDQGHYSVVKSAGVLGVGRENLRLIDTDHLGRMSVSSLQRTIQADLKNGLKPFFINATAGTTVLGAVDAIEEIRDVADEHKIWMHVDGAFGGSVLLSRRLRPLVKGLEKADSVTWNAHKMMGVPLSASALLLKNRELLERNLSESAEYLFQTEERQFNPGIRSIQCGRRNDALKLWMAWQYYGHSGYEKRIEQLFDLAAQVAERIRRDAELNLVVPPQTINVCFEYPGVPSERICAELDKQGIGKVGYGSWRRFDFVRLVCVDPAIDFEEICDFLEEIKVVARGLKRESCSQTSSVPESAMAD